MNNRIFELAKQVDLIKWDTLPSGAITPDHDSVVKAKRFAELIIEDSIAAIRAKYFDRGTTEAVIAIETHFGVKE